MPIGPISRDAPGPARQQPSGRLSLYWWLPEYLPVPHHWTCRLVDARDGTLVLTSEVEPVPDLADVSAGVASRRIAAEVSGETVAELVRDDLVAQVRYYQVSHNVDSLEALHRLSMELGLPHARETSGPSWSMGAPVTVANAEPKADKKKVRVAAEEDIPLGPLSHVTLAHLVVAIDAEPSAASFFVAVDEAVELVHTTIRGLHAATGLAWHLPMPEAQPLHMLAGLDRVERGLIVPVWGLTVYSPRLELLAAAGDLDAEQIEHLQRAEIEAAQHSPRSLVLDLRRQAVTAARRSADPRTAIVMAAATCEAWIDFVLGALLWEEGMSPEEGAAELGRLRDSKQRLQRSLGPRLGGSWDIDRVSALSAWDSHVREARNRVVHSGGLPSLQLASISLDAMFGLLSLTLDRLCAGRTRNRYPIAALIVAQRVSLEERGGWTARLRRAADEADELDLVGVFSRWYSVVSSLLLPTRMRREPAESSRPELVRLSDGRVYWVQHDWDAHMARLIDVDPDVAEILLLEVAPADGHAVTFSFGQEIPFKSAGAWVPEHRLLPRVALMRDPAMWDFPADAPVPSIVQEAKEPRGGA